MRSPCTPDCEKRSVTCHCECAEYIAFRAHRDEMNERRSAEYESRPFPRSLEMKYLKNLKAGRVNR